MNFEKNSTNSNINMPYVYKLFYNIKLKDYFAMLALFLDGCYNSEYSRLSVYSDADERYTPRKGFRLENKDVNPDITIGEMLCIASRLRTCDYDEIENPSFTPLGKDILGCEIVQSLMITPFYHMFCTEKGRKAFENLTNTKSI
ncbi:MAG: hypothetical protein IJZ65_11070 [Ruminiclostridium sp.]|nr:hypothetical protein [Ruminiclostridium sp.]